MAAPPGVSYSTSYTRRLHFIKRTALTFSLDWLWQECDAPTGSAGGSFPTFDLIGWSKPKTDNDSQMSGKAVSIISCSYAKLS